MARPHGTKNIKTPDDLWLLFTEYRDNLKDIEVPISHVKLGSTILSYREPMTMEGFYTFCYNKDLTVHHYIDNPENAYDDYRGIVTRIKNEIYSNNFNRAAVGLYKEALIAKQLGLAEKQEIKHQASVSILNIDPLDSSNDSTNNSPQKDSKS